MQKDKKISVALNIAILDTFILMDLQDQIIHHLAQKLLDTSGSQRENCGRVSIIVVILTLYHRHRDRVV